MLAPPHTSPGEAQEQTLVVECGAVSHCIDGQHCPEPGVHAAPLPRQEEPPLLLEDPPPPLLPLEEPPLLPPPVGHGVDVELLQPSSSDTMSRAFVRIPRIPSFMGT